MFKQSDKNRQNVASKPAYGLAGGESKIQKNQFHTLEIAKIMSLSYV